MPTQAEQNRLIIEHTWLVAPIAADYRGQKNVQFEDIVAQGMVGLVVAARKWNPLLAKFNTYATDKIRSHIADFIRDWDDLSDFDEIPTSEGERLIYEWQNSFFALYENWETDPRSPEDILSRFEDIADKRDLMHAAFMSLSKRERQMIDAYFVRSPRVQLEQIARDHRVSYKKTSDIIYRALGKMREIIEKIEEKRREDDNVIQFRPAKKQLPESLTKLIKAASD